MESSVTFYCSVLSLTLLRANAFVDGHILLLLFSVLELSGKFELFFIRYSTACDYDFGFLRLQDPTSEQRRQLQVEFTVYAFDRGGEENQFEVIMRLPQIYTSITMKANYAAHSPGYELLRNLLPNEASRSFERWSMQRPFAFVTLQWRL